MVKTTRSVPSLLVLFALLPWSLLPSSLACGRILDGIRIDEGFTQGGDRGMTSGMRFPQDPVVPCQKVIGDTAM